MNTLLRGLTDLVYQFQHNWDLAGRHGSRSILVWESDDLINWSHERLVELEDPTAGMVWAPDATWDEDKQAYLVYWSSHFFEDIDTEHLGAHTNSLIRYAYTSDFRTFTKAADFVKVPDVSIIDMALLSVNAKSYVRFLKSQTTNNSSYTSYVYMETTDTGLWGHWTRPGDPQSFIFPNCEGPYAWWDNQDTTKAYLLLDNIGLEKPQYIPFEAVDFRSQQSWQKSDASRFPSGRRHGSVIGIDKTTYEALREHFS